jgi:hypothetical protein
MRDLRVCVTAGQAEIENADSRQRQLGGRIAVLASHLPRLQPDVRRLDVAMNQAPSMRRRHSLRHLHANAYDLG